MEVAFWQVDQEWGLGVFNFDHNTKITYKVHKSFLVSSWKYHKVDHPGGRDDIFWIFLATLNLPTSGLTSLRNIYTLSIYTFYKVISKSTSNKLKRVFGLQVRCRELVIFKIRNFLRNCLDFLGDFSWIFLEDFFGKNFLGRIFCEDFLWGSFWEDLFGRIFLGGFFLGRFFWEEFFVYIVKVS